MRSRTGHLHQLLALGLVTLLVATCASKADLPPDALAPPRVVYVYDGVGRLRAVTDPEAETAVYSYDPVGNITGIERFPSDEVSVLAVTPRRAAVGAEVVIHGTGLDDASVFFGDAEAEVTESSDVELTVTVPDGAETGPVAVRAAGGKASSDAAFEVEESRAPAIDGFSPRIVAVGDTVTLEGKRFTGDRLLDTVVLDGRSYGAVGSASTTELAFTVPATAASGPVSVSTPAGVAESDENLYVVPWGYAADDVEAAGRAELGRSEDVEIGRPGKIALVAFHGEKGQDLRLQLSAGETSYCTMGFGLTGPGGIDMRPPALHDGDSCTGDLPELRDLPSTGTYTLLIVPDDQAASFGLTIEEGGSGAEDEPADQPTTSEQGDPPGPGAAGHEPAPVAAATPGGVTDGDPRYPVDLASGSFVFADTDLVVSDISPLSVARSYQPVSGPASSNVAAFGLGSSMELDMRLELSPAYQWAKLIMPGGVPLLFERTTEGIEPEDAVFEHTASPTAFYGAQIAGSGHGWDLTLVDGTTLVFGPGPTALLQAIRDRNGNQTTVQRARDDQRLTQAYGNATGDVVSVHTATGRSIHFRYDGSHRVVEARDHLGRTASYSYDGRSRLVAVAYSSGGRVAYGYDDANRIRTITGPDGVALVTNDYDAAGRVTRQVLGDGATYSFGYVTDAEGRVTRAEVTDPAGLVRRVAFDEGFWVTDTYAADTPHAQALTAERDPDTHFVTALVGPSGQRTGYGYDEAGNLSSLTTSPTGSEGAPATATSELVHEPRFQEIASATDPTGIETELRYDDAGNMVGEIGPTGAETTYRYDSMGRLTEATDAEGNSVSVDYELAHRITLTDQDGHHSSEFYDAAGRLAVVTDPDGNQTRFGYDDQDRLVSVVDAQGDETTCAYDAAGNVTSVSDAAGHTTSYTYDALGRPLTRTDPSGAVDRYAYDAAGDLTQHVDRRGLRSTFDYDLFGRLTRAAFGVTSGGAASTIDYSYDAAGRLVEIDDPAYGVVDLDYDDAGRLVGETTPQGHITHAYDLAGRPTSTTIDHGPATTYDYDDETGALTRVARGDVEVAADHDRLGRPSRVHLPGGVTADYDYGGNGQLRGIDYSDGDDDLGGLLYGYDASGRRTTVAGDLAATGVPEAVSDVHHDAANRLTRWGGRRLEYDRAGNLISDGTSTYTWDARGQLTAIDGARKASFTYDPLGRRSSKTIDGTTTTYLYDGANIAQERRGDAGPVTYLTGPAPDEVFARTTGEATTTFLRDGSGSVIGLAGPDGSVTTSYTYDPFGASAARAEDDDNALGYTGRELDETGLAYHRARYYQPETGRFLSEDPLGFGGGDPNLYAYGADDPVDHVDPSGMCFGTALVSLGFSAVLDQQLLDVGQALIDGTMSSEEIAVRLDEINLGIDANFDFLFLGCGGESLMTPSLDGVFGRGMGDYGRTAGSEAAGSARPVPDATYGTPPGRATPAGRGTPPGRRPSGPFERDPARPDPPDWLRQVNPSRSQSNCVGIAMAVDFRLATGRTRLAPNSGCRDLTSSLWKLYRRPIVPVTGRAQIESMLRQPGSRGIVIGNRSTEPGHVFNAYNNNGVIEFLDGSTGGWATFDDGFDSFSFLRTG